jgi:2-polyprenyl-6-methoxyphenol hydroxylase-like FAD-dependent oxidoreductase
MLGSIRNGGLEMSDYDVIVIGARVAGAPTAMLLAKRGYRVLLVDRATFPSDTVSTHLIHPPGMAALERWGLAGLVVATGCPPVTSYRLDLGPFAIVGQPRGLPTAPHSFAPRRTALDQILVEAAAAAGVEVRQGLVVEQLIVEDGTVRGIRARTGGRQVDERATVVIGADGVRSFVGDAVGAKVYHAAPTHSVLYYAYWSGLPFRGEFNLYARERRGLGVISTSDDLTVVVAAWPMDEFEANRRDVAGNYRGAYKTDPELDTYLQAGRRESRIFGATMPNHYRQSFGPGWALVGDAGYVKDATTAQGMTDAFHDAESLAAALDDALSGRRPFGDALGDHQRARDDRTRRMFDFTGQFAGFEPPSDEEAGLFAAVAADAQASEDFASVMAGTMAVEAFFDPAYLGRLVGKPAA